VQQGKLLIDHVFMLVRSDEVDAVVDDLAGFGLEESSRRAHVGLGTSNIFFCFDNAFLEILWVADRDEAVQSELGRRLLARLDGREQQATPFGIGFRTLTPEDPLPFDTWDFLPPGTSGLKPVPIARSSDDPAQPLLFRAQRVRRPDQWIDGKAGARQTKAAIAEIIGLRFSPPRGVHCSADLERLQDLGIVTLSENDGGAQMTLTASRIGERPTFELKLQSPLL
jgi:hypothetical protein